MLESGLSAVYFMKMPIELMCGELRAIDEESEIVNVMGNSNIVDAVNRICGMRLSVNRVQVKLKDKDDAYIVVVEDPIKIYRMEVHDIV